MSNPQPKIYPIYITAADVQTGQLTLSDGGETDVNLPPLGGDYVIWMIGSGANNIARITAITKEDDGSQNLFYFGPKELQTDQGTFWAGIILGAPIGAFEDYSITWQDTDGYEHTYDPKIVMNP